ncbi:MAG: hypothetical protein J6U37_06220 [Lachnospiraceae bacterium]|nr:hypothetical protein [Lachnospiraceae bacterium]
MIEMTLYDIHRNDPQTPKWALLERYEYCQDFLDRKPSHLSFREILHRFFR